MWTELSSLPSFHFPCTHHTQAIDDCCHTDDSPSLLSSYMSACRYQIPPTASLLQPLTCSFGDRVSSVERRGKETPEHNGGAVECSAGTPRYMFHFYSGIFLVFADTAAVLLYVDVSATTTDHRHTACCLAAGWVCPASSRPKT